MKVGEARALTHRGAKKKVNEDGLLQIPDVPLYAIVDGRGGTEAQEHALGLLRKRTRALYRKIKDVSKSASSSNRLAVGAFFEEVFRDIHQELIDLSDDLEVPTLASSMVAVTLIEECAYITHIGNVRAYLKRDGDLWALTNDHTVAMTQLNQGLITQAEYEKSPQRMVLTQALGHASQFEVAFSEVWLLPGDILVLCSDGLTRVVSDQTICETLHRMDLAGATKDLLRQALAARTPDNVSLVTLRIKEDNALASSTNVIQTLQNVFLFQGLSEADRSMVTPYLEDVSVEPGTIIVRENDTTDDLFYVVIEGKVRVSLDQTHLVDIGPGGQFGELGLVGESRRTATVTALTKTRLFALNRERFHEILRNKPKLAAPLLLPLLERVKERLTDVTNRLAKLEGSKQS